MRGYTTPAPRVASRCGSCPSPNRPPNDVVVGVSAYGLNRGELALLEQRNDGWCPGQDIAGTVVTGAADRSGPPEGSRVVGIADGDGWSARVRGRGVFREVAALIPPEDAEGK